VTIDQAGAGQPASIKTESYDFNSNINTSFRDIRMVHRWLPRRLMALIYHLEVAGTWGGLVLNVGYSAGRTLKMVGYILAYATISPIMIGLNRQRITEATHAVVFWLALIVAILFILAVIALFIGLALEAAGTIK
jgi:hypothetical protein